MPTNTGGSNTMAQEPALNLLLDDLEDAGKISDPTAVIEAFAAWAKKGGRELYPHQLDAALAIAADEHVIAATPTGSGKSMIALAGHLVALSRGQRSYYTAPLKALVSEKFFDLAALFGTDNVGMITGDVSLNPEAPIISCTAEILANQALADGATIDCGIAIMDEFHFYGDHQRGWAWQIPLLEMTKTQMVLMSATLGNIDFFKKDLTARTCRSVAVIDNAARPVPLEFNYTYDETSDLVDRLMKQGRWPIYLVHFAQRDAVERATALAATSKVSREQRDKVAQAIKGFSFGGGFGKTLKALLRAGIGVHHAGMLPRYRRLVEKLTQDGLLVAICGTDTLGVGINVPIRTVVLTSLTKFDGRRSRHLSAREFHQIAGRAGRAGFDTIGFVEVQAPAHEIENAKIKARAGAVVNGKKSGGRAKLKQAPEGFVSWSEGTFDRLREAQPEALTSQFSMTHSLVLNVLSGGRDAAKHLVWLARNNHDKPRERNPHLRTLGQIYSSLRTAEVVEWKDGKLVLTRELPDSFALNQTLSPFALAAVELLDPDSDTYALDVVSVVESILEDPRPLLYAQRKVARDQAMAAMKAEGLEYDERTEALDQITWPRPLAELLEGAFSTFRQTNPWVAGNEPSPKSVVRQMVENAYTFSALISRYDLARSEGVVLRYLTDAYRALYQIVPQSARNEEFDAIVTWLGDLVRAVDSSLLAEWEMMGTSERKEIPDTVGKELAFGADADGNVSFSANKHAFTTAVRKALFRRVELMAREDVDGLLALGDPGWDADRWNNVLDRYYAEYDWIATDQDARSATLFKVISAPTEADLVELGMDLDSPLAGRALEGRLWLAQQIILDPEGELPWRIWAVADLDASDQASREGSPTAIVHTVSVSAE